jgi:hypothetical protein
MVTLTTASKVDSDMVNLTTVLPVARERVCVHRALALRCPSREGQTAYHACT